MNKNNYLIKSFLTILGLAFFSLSFGQTYCTTGFTVTTYSKIGNVKLVGNSVTLDNASTACNGYENFTTGVPVPDLAAGGGPYTLTVDKITCNGNWRFQCGAWIDYNADGDFTDAGEYLGNRVYGTAGTTGTVTWNFSTPCSITAGNTRMRVVLWEDGTPNSCTQSGFGQSEDYTVNLGLPSGLSSNFFVPDSAFVNTPVAFVNSNQSGYIGHNWTINGKSFSTTNATEIFSTPGIYNVKLVSENCLGKDSTTKTVKIVAPTAAPVANFVSDKNVVEIFEPFRLIDLSSNGPIFWDWIITNGTDTINGDNQPNLRGGDPYINKNPTVSTGNYSGSVLPGTWDVCLKASNVPYGASPVYCKVGYITVQQTNFDIGPGTSLPANIITATSGNIYDKGGVNNNYTAPESNLEALIAPCGAQSVSLDFSLFKLKANANLKIYDGVNALGTPLHSGSGFTAGNEPSGTITANSGAMYLLWNSTAGGTDEGFAATWTSVAGAGAAPVADFSFPGPDVYNAVTLDFTNTSANAEGNTAFEWTIAGPDAKAGVTRHLNNITFTSVGSYTATLKVTGCDGVVSTVTKAFTVLAPNTPTNLDFTADNRRPAVGDDVTFTASSDKANRWEWDFFPPTGVSANAPSTDDLSERSFKFTTPGTYAVQLKGYNSIDSANSEATVVKTSYVIVVQNCVPVIGVTTSADVGISYVSIEDVVTGDKSENSSAAGLVGYTDYSDIGTVDLNFGGTYNFEVRRTTNVNLMTRKIWVDWNVDGDFEDAGELVAAESAPGTSMSWSGSFSVPDATAAFDAATTLRVGVSYDNDLNLPCGANSNGAANRIGEFEDYSIRVVNDGDEPVITLINADTIYVEQNAVPAYITAGATASDPSQGDITANISMVSDVDQSLPGVYYEDYNVMDASGNPAPQVTRVVYVVSDQTAPVITITGAADTTIEVGTVWIDLPASALDNKEGDLSDAIVTSGTVDYNTLGDYIITYAIQDNQGNASSATRTVRVVDTELPVIENASADKASACWVVEVQLQNIFADITTATDNYNSLGGGLTFKANPAAAQGGAAVDTRFQGTTSVIYTATDESGNVTTQCIDYVVKDYVAPVIDLRTLDVINHRVNTPYSPVSATASDNLYSNTQISLTSSSNVDPYTLGAYQDTYTATDAAGNVSTKIRTVNVIDDVAPVISGKKGAVLKLGVGSSVNAIDYVLFKDNYDAPADLLANHTVVYSDINLQEAGLYSVVFETTDKSGNASKKYTLYVEVNYNFEKQTNSVNDLSLEDMLAVSPNPTSGKLNINVNLPENEVINIAVFNTMGQQVALVENGTVSNSSYTLNLDNQVNGVYYVKMTVNGNIISKKVMLNK